MRDTALSFFAAVEQQIHALSSQEFHRRQGRAKILLEEWYPISRLALHLKQPGLEIQVEAFGDSSVADGRIEELGFRERSFDVQVTYVEDYEGSLRRELMDALGKSSYSTAATSRRSTSSIAPRMNSSKRPKHRIKRTRFRRSS